MRARKVSVIIPFHNAGSFLRSAIESALGQQYPNIEIVLVNDGSTDNSLIIAESYRAENIKVSSQPKRGACSARNHGFLISTGDYIQYLDGDDMLAPMKIIQQIGSIGEQEDSLLMSSRFIRFYNDGPLPEFPRKNEFLDRSWDNPIDWLVYAWSGKGMGQTSTWLTPRKLIEKAGPWDERLRVNQDGEFFCRVLLQASAIRFCNDSFVYYRSGNSSSISQNITRDKADSLLLSYQLNARSILSKENSVRVKRAIAFRYRSFIYEFYDKYPDLVAEAEKALAGLGVEEYPLVGGKHFKMLARIIGFERSLKLRTMMRGRKN